jgi:hypothetical protein
VLTQPPQYALKPYILTKRIYSLLLNLRTLQYLQRKATYHWMRFVIATLSSLILLSYVLMGSCLYHRMLRTSNYAKANTPDTVLMDFWTIRLQSDIRRCISRIGVLQGTTTSPSFSPACHLLAIVPSVSVHTVPSFLSPYHIST